MFIDRLVKTENCMYLFQTLSVNTSGEEAKGGFIELEGIINAAKYIVEECEHVKLRGLMTIGSAENSKKSAEDDTPNPDFTKKLV